MFMSRQKHPDKTQHPQKAEWRRRLLTVTNSCSEGSPERRQRRQGGDTAIWAEGHFGKKAFGQPEHNVLSTNDLPVLSQTLDADEC